MFQTKRIGMLACFGLGLLMTTGAFADCRKKIALTTESAGFAVDASGSAEVRASGNQQRFKVSIDSNVDATYAVVVGGSIVGTITTVLGQGELELNNNNGKTLPAAVNPVCGVGSFSVINGSGAAVLNGTF